MLRLASVRVESLWDDVLPDEVRALPDDLAALDELLSDAALLAPIEQRWQRQAEAIGRSALAVGRPTISMATYVRLMVVKHRSGAAGRRLRALTRSMRRRSGQAKEEVLELTKQTGQLLAKSVREARRLAANARRRARGRGARAKLKAARKLEELADRCE